MDEGSLGTMMTSQDGSAPGGLAAAPRSSAGAAEIAKAYRGGLGVETIARRTGLPVREVYWILGRENVAIRPARAVRGTKPETLRLLRRIRRLRAEGHTYKEIGRQCGIAPGTVGVMLSTFREIEL